MLDKKLREKILKEVNFNKEELENKKKIILNLVENLKKVVDENILKINFGGSYSKNTFLKKDFDVDLFFCFEKDLEDKKMSSICYNILKKLNIKINIEKGSRDYFSFEYKKIKFEVVPTKKILLKNIQNFENTSDISIFHKDYLIKKSQKNKELVNEIKLAKIFFKAKNFYGAESYINGFSGHSIELLIVYFKSLENLIKSAKNFSKREIVDIENFYKNEKEVLKKIEKTKLSNLIVIDPILKNRNALKCLSEENYYKFILMCKQIKKLSEKDFKIKKINLENIKKKYKTFSHKNDFKIIFFEFNFIKKKDPKDIIGTKFLKLQKKLKSTFLKNNFRLIIDDFKIDFQNQKCLFIFIFESDKPKKFKKIKGPSIFMKYNYLEFIKKRGEVFLENEFLYSFKINKKINLKKFTKFKKKDFEKLSSNNMKFISDFKIDLI